MPRARRSASGSAMPLGQEAMPWAHPASIMLWATRPTSKSTSPPPGVTVMVTTSAAPSTFRGP